MKRQGAGYRRKKRHVLLKLFMITAGVMLMFFLLACHLMNDIIGPNMEETARIKAAAIVSRTVNLSLTEELEKRKKEGNLFTEQRNSKGELEMVQADSVKINLLMSQLAMNIQEEFSRSGQEKFPLSLGTLIGSRLLSQSKPYMTITIVPLSVTSMDFRTEFETQGINQTKYKIYVILECRVKMLAPFSTEIFKVKHTVLVAETVILGTVPDSYVQVPKESILDAT